MHQLLPKLVRSGFSVLLFALLFFAAESSFAQFDPKNPDPAKVSADELTAWGKKNISDWKAVFGNQPEEWNTLQMEFYKSARLKALSDAEKSKFLAMSDEDFEKLFGGPMDTWKIEDMLFYSAIQDAKN
jgi:hypothetical protein